MLRNHEQLTRDENDNSSVQNNMVYHAACRNVSTRFDACWWSLQHQRFGSNSSHIDCKTSFRRIKLMLVFQHDSPYTVIQRIQVSEVWNFFVSITRCELLTISYILLMLTKRKIRELTGFTCILIASRSIKIS